MSVDGDIDHDALVREAATTAGLDPKRVARLAVKWTGEIVKARLEEILGEDGETQRGRVQRSDVAWKGPPLWLAMQSDDAVPPDLPLAVMPLPEAYRGAASLGQLPKPVQDHLRDTLDGWARTSGGVTPPHRVSAWRSDCGHAYASPYHLWVDLHTREVLLAVEERTKGKIMRGMAMTGLAGAGAGGFGLLLGPYVAVLSLVFGSTVAAVQVRDGLKRKYRTVYAADPKR